MTETQVLRRRVYYIGGYDPAPPAAVFGRFVKELRRFEQTWGASTTVSELGVRDDLATWRISASGPNWHTETEMNLVRWDDVISSAGERPAWSRLAPGIVAFGDFLISGALSAYLRSSWRYAMFFLYPVLILFLIAGLCIGAALFSFALKGSYFISLLVFLSAAWLLLHAADRWLYLGLLIDDWIFARDYIRNGNGILADRLQRIAAEISRCHSSEATDETLVVGHSLGAVLAIDLIDRAVKIERESSGGSRKIAFLSVGASILKIGLHRAAQEFRAAIGRVSANSNVFWADYRARSDVMNFFGADLLSHLKLPPTGSPLARNVSIRRMITPARYPRLRKNWYRMHCQFVRGNDRRAPYDYFMSTCGPLSAERIARSERGAMDMFDADGRLIEVTDFPREFDAVGAVKP